MYAIEIGEHESGQGLDRVEPMVDLLTPKVLLEPTLHESYKSSSFEILY